MVSPAYHRSVQLLGGVIVIVLVSSPVAGVRQEAPECRGHRPSVATEVPLKGGNNKIGRLTFINIRH